MKIYSLITNEVEKNSMFAFPQNQGLVDGFVVENEKDTVIVLINGENAKKQVQVNIDDTLYYVELAPDSLSKVII